MACIQHNTQINNLIVDLGCSLLQFVGEASPWSPANATAARETVTRAHNQQKQHLDQLVQLLIDRRWPVDFGLYPAEFTDLHFLSLKALLPRVIDSQTAILAELDEAVHTCIDDPEAMAVLMTVLAGERSITEQLKSLQM